MQQSDEFPRLSDALGEPPSGGVWDAPLSEAPFAFFDLEMTGLDPARDAILEVGVIRVERGALADCFESLVATNVPSAPTAIAQHGLDDAALAGAPDFAAIGARLRALFDGAIPVAHGAERDIEFLRAAFARLSVEPSPVVHVVDTLVLSRRALCAESYALGTLVAQLQLMPRRWHRAGEDARATRDLFNALVPQFSPRNARDLWEVRVGQRGNVRVREAIALALKACQQSGSRCRLVARSPGKPLAVLEGIVESWDRPHVRLALRDGHVRLLRADRVLRVELL